VEAELRPGYAPGSGEPQSAAVTRLVADLIGFRARLGLDRVVVINVSAADPPVTVVPELETPSAVDTALAGGAVGLLPPSGLYAWAAYTAGCPYVDFTPSAGARLRAVMGLARDCGLPWAGTAGKTGESLVKATLAPMFAARSLDVRSWSSVSLDGGSSGSRPPAPGVAGALGRRVAGPSHVHHVPDLGEWTTGWDMVSFVGFLGARMSLQFTLTGSESALAAPLVLDLARLVARAHQVGLSGPLGELGFFFDDPVAASTHSVEAQFVELCMWAGGLGR
jgi:myo-inositol-1-phosphate synthase